MSKKHLQSAMCAFILNSVLQFFRHLEWVSSLSLLATIAVVLNYLYLQILRTHTTLFTIFSFFTHIFLLFSPQNLYTKVQPCYRCLTEREKYSQELGCVMDTLEVVPDIVTLKEERQTAAEGTVGSHFAFATYMFFALSSSRDHWAQRLCFSYLILSNTWKWLNRKIYIEKQFN